MLHIQAATTRHVTNHYSTLGCYHSNISGSSSSSSSSGSGQDCQCAVFLKPSHPPTHHKPPTVVHQGDLYIPTRNTLHPEVIMENHLIYTLRGAIPGDLRCQLQSPYGILQSTHIKCGIVSSSICHLILGVQGQGHECTCHFTRKNILQT